MQDIIAKFGLEARFYACSAENMDANHLVEFLDARGKLVQRPGGKFSVLTVNLLAGGSWACGYKVIVQKNQKPVSLSKKSTAACADAIHDLLVSCSVDSTGSVEADQRWKEILASDFFIHLVGAESFELDIATKETIKVREILLPLADNKRPDYVFVRDGHNVRAYCRSVNLLFCSSSRATKGCRSKPLSSVS